MKTLVLTTYSYPYGTGETFLANELPYLSKVFQKIILVPENVTGEAKTIPSNCEVRLIAINNHFPLKKMVLRFGFMAIRHLIYCWRNDNTPESKVFYAIKKWKIRWLDLLGEHYKGIQLINQLPELTNNDTILYHYWMINFARYASWMKQSGIIQNKQICRIHGYDYELEQNKKKHFIFRNAELRGYNTVVAACDYARNYVQPYSQHTTLSTNKLGVESALENNELSYNNKLVVSCSNLVLSKRVDLIYESLKATGEKLRWVHFGDGEELERIKATVVAEKYNNLVIDFRGNVDNKEILTFYKTQKPLVFISASELEGGCPVSIQEAFSCSIPVIAVGVGGISEMVNDSVGFLVENQGVIAGLSNALIHFIHLPQISIAEKRVNAFQKWKTEYNSKINYPTFIKEILCAE